MRHFKTLHINRKELGCLELRDPSLSINWYESSGGNSVCVNAESQNLISLRDKVKCFGMNSDFVTTDLLN